MGIDKQFVMKYLQCGSRAVGSGQGQPFIEGQSYALVGSRWNGEKLLGDGEKAKKQGWEAKGRI